MHRPSIDSFVTLDRRFYIVMPLDALHARKLGYSYRVEESSLGADLAKVQDLQRRCPLSRLHGAFL